MDEELLTIREAAKRIGMSISWLYEHKDEVGYYQLGGAIRFAPSDLEKWLAQCRVQKQGKQEAPPPRLPPAPKHLSLD